MALLLRSQVAWSVTSPTSKPGKTSSDLLRRVNEGKIKQTNLLTSSETLQTEDSALRAQPRYRSRSARVDHVPFLGQVSSLHSLMYFLKIESWWSPKYRFIERPGHACRVVRGQRRQLSSSLILSLVRCLPQHPTLSPPSTRTNHCFHTLHVEVLGYSCSWHQFFSLRLSTHTQEA